MKHLKKIIGIIKKKITPHPDSGEIDIYNIPLSTVHRYGPITEEQAEELMKLIDSF